VKFTTLASGDRFSDAEFEKFEAEILKHQVPKLEKELNNQLWIAKDRKLTEVVV
jgi:hypothetical protein